VLPLLLPMSNDLLLAFLWDAIAFEASLPVLRQAINTDLAWHDRLRLELPLSGKRAYKRLIHSLLRCQGVPRRNFFPIIHAGVPGQPALRGMWGGCAVCTCHLHARRNCLAGATSTVTYTLCAEVAGLQVRDLWKRFDEEAGYQCFKGGAEVNVKTRKKTSFGRPAPPRSASQPGTRRHLTAVRVPAQRGPRGASQLHQAAAWQHPERHYPLCPPMSPRMSRDGPRPAIRRSVEHDRGLIRGRRLDGLRQVGFDTTLFSWISARRGGLSTAIEAGVPEHILCMQSGHARTSRRGDTSSAAAPRCCTTRGRPSTSKTPTNNLRILHCSVLQGDGLSGRIWASAPSGSEIRAGPPGPARAVTSKVTVATPGGT
jgi:hypothetical protein